MPARRLYAEEHEAFRDAFRSFLNAEALPAAAAWEEAGMVSRGFWRSAARMGFVGFEAPERLGGSGVADFRFNAVIAEEVADSGTVGDGFAMANDIVGPYLYDYASEEQKQRWVPGFATGEIVAAIAMSEPGAGSDLAGVATTARADGDEIVLRGTKTFITNGITADLVLVLAKSGDAHGEMSMVAVEAGTPGFSRGPALHKIGRKAQDTSELFFDDVRVPRGNLIGEPGRAFDMVKLNLPRERMSIAVYAVASARRALALALEHAAQRSTFGKRLDTHQVVIHQLAELHTAIEVAQSHIDACVVALNEARLSAEDAAGAKYWATDLEFATIDRVLQLFGGYGYMEEYPIARMWRDARVQRIYGGANDIMKEIVGRGLLSRR